MVRADLKFYQVILIGIAVGLVIGISGTLIAERCDVESAMKPLYYVIEQLGGRVCK